MNSCQLNQICSTNAHAGSKEMLLVNTDRHYSINIKITTITKETQIWTKAKET